MKWTFEQIQMSNYSILSHLAFHMILCYAYSLHVVYVMCVCDVCFIFLDVSVLEKSNGNNIETFLLILLLSSILSTEKIGS